MTEKSFKQLCARYYGWRHTKSFSADVRKAAKIVESWPDWKKAWGKGIQR